MNINVVMTTPTRKIAGGHKIIYKYLNYFAEQGAVCKIYYNSQNGDNSHHVPKVIYKQYRKLITKLFPRYIKLNTNIQKVCIDSVVDENILDGDIIFATLAETAIDVKNLSDSKGKKCYFIQDFENWFFKDEDVFETYMYGMKNIVVSKWLKELVDQYTNDETVYVRNGIDKDIFKCNFPIEERKNVIGCLYNSDERKNMKMAFDAMEIIYEKYGRNVEFIMYGSEKRPRNMPSYIKYKRNLNEYQVAKLMNSCAIFLLPSNVEGFGLTGLESQACGCALVATKCKGVIEYATNSNSCLINIGDLDALIKNIMKLIEDSKYRQCIAYNALEDSEKYSEMNSYKKMWKVISNYI